jgi:hypothetical protein
MYVWMDYPLQAFRYPSEDYSSHDTHYFNSPHTHWPDFTNAESLQCGGTSLSSYMAVAGVTNAQEGLCLFVRSPFLTAADNLLKVTYLYQEGVTDLTAHTDPAEVGGWTGERAVETGGGGKVGIERDASSL